MNQPKQKSSSKSNKTNNKKTLTKVKEEEPIHIQELDLSKEEMNAIEEQLNNQSSEESINE
jgi:hypothetical protein